MQKKIVKKSPLELLFILNWEIHPLDPQPHRYCMLASMASAPRVTRCSLGLYWSRDLCSKHALAGWGMSSYVSQIVRGSEIWWFMTSAHSLSTALRFILNCCLFFPVFNQGDEGKSWYILLRGSVNVVIYGKVRSFSSSELTFLHLARHALKLWIYLKPNISSNIFQILLH